MQVKEKKKGSCLRFGPNDLSRMSSILYYIVLYSVRNIIALHEMLVHIITVELSLHFIVFHTINLHLFENTFYILHMF